MSEGSPLRLSFDSFELDESNARLTLAGQPVPLAPKALALLCELARQPGQLVAKEALLDAVWGHQYVSESNLKTTISEVRAALADDAKQPRYIETVSRRGYRFIGTPGPRPSAHPAPAETPTPAAACVHDDLLGDAVAMVGREAALARLRGAWQAATGGRTRCFWVAGEAGVGKTLLIDRFVASLGAVPCSRGQCIEQFGAGEPYLPVLEALGSLCRRDATLVPLLRAVAPTWLLQLPWLCDEAERARLQRDLAGTHQDRMLREFAELLDRYTATLPQPLVLVTEDLHWSDHATVRLIDHLARRNGDARLLWLGTFRLPELVAEDHPLNGLRHELRLRGLCDELVLQPFSEADLARYLGERFPTLAPSERFVQSLHQHTDGLPLFVVNVIDDLLSEGMIDPIGGGTWADAPLPAARQVPTRLVGLVERQIARLSASERPLLEAASVCGADFRLRVLAGLVGRGSSEVAAACDALVQQHYWLRDLAVEELNDGSLDTRYGFRHTLYRDVLYQRLGPSRQVQLHRRTAELLEELPPAFGAETPAVELAFHCERGRAVTAALRHYIDAVDSALQRFASTEAMQLAQHGLTLLPRCPDGTARREAELALIARYGAACQRIGGLGTAEVTHAYERAQALCDQLPASPERTWVMAGLGWSLFARGEYGRLDALIQRLQALAETLQDPTLLTSACCLHGLVLSHQGHAQASLDQLQRGLAACPPLVEGQRPAPYMFDPIVSLQALQAMPLVDLGRPDAACAQLAVADHRAAALRQPVSLQMVLWCRAVLDFQLERPEQVLDHMARMEQVTSRHEVAQLSGPIHWFRGWAQARLGRPYEGHQAILAGLENHTRLGNRSTMTYVHGMAAEAMLLAGEWRAAAGHLQDGLDLAEALGEQAFVPWLHLLMARVHLGRDDLDAASEAMRTARAQAEARQAPWPALQALVALCALPDATPAERAALASAVAAQREGVETPLVRQARALCG